MKTDVMYVKRAPVAKVERLPDDFVDEYVYDIGVDDDTPYFFGNDVLLHNSCYFSGYEVLKDDPQYADVEWTKETVIELYDNIAETVNDSFPEFMARTFNTSLERGGIIKAGRELVASKALFIKKKKYACLMYDKEGERLDTGNKPGKLKVMGLDLKRADTPKFMQNFLERLLMDFLTDAPREDMFEQIRQFREEFKKRPGWEKGTPKKVNALSDFAEREAKAAKRSVDAGTFEKNARGKSTGKIDMPGHVRASLNWNKMCDEMGDLYSMRIGDGAKVIVCKLRPNVLGIDSIAYPIDEMHLPQWFKELPFDHAAMEDTIIDNKLENLFGVLNWDFNDTKEVPANDIFVFPG